MPNPDTAERLRWYPGKAYRAALNSPIPHLSYVKRSELVLWSPDRVFAEWFAAAWNAAQSVSKS